MPPPQSPLWAAVFRALLGGRTDRERVYCTPPDGRVSMSRVRARTGLGIAAKLKEKR